MLCHNIYRNDMKFLQFLLFFLLAFFLSGCVQIETPHRGVVKDAETGDPIKGVVVHIDLESGMPLGPDGVTRWKDSYETVTNAKGKYSLSMKLKGNLPLEFPTGHSILFFKAGYFHSEIFEPALNNTVSLYPIKYYLDYLEYRSFNEASSNSHLYYYDKEPEAFAEYKKELDKMEHLQFARFGERGEFVSVPNAQFKRMSCRMEIEYDHGNHSTPYTFGISGNVCLLFDETSRKMMICDARGNIKELEDTELIQYNFLAAAPDENKAVFANSYSIYIPHTPYTYLANNVTPQKGNIIALAGNSREFLTLEDNGLYLCYFLIWHDISKGCISIDDVLNDENARFILLTHGYSPAADHVYFVITKNTFSYQIHKVTFESTSLGETQLTFTEQLLPSFPADDEIIDFASNGRIFFIAFKRSGIKKYSLDRHRRGFLKEERDFYKNSHDLFLEKSIAAIELGWSITGRVLYVTVGDSTIYRLSLDGVPDYRIKILEQ